MSAALESDQPLLRPPARWSMALAALAPVALGGIVAARAGQASPLVAVPAIVFGVVAATAPALYIASAATGAAPSVAAVVRAVITALGAFGVALAGLVVPAAFLSLSSLTGTTTLVVTSAALAAAGFLAMSRLASELRRGKPPAAMAPRVVFAVWAIATLGIAARLWLDFAHEVIA